MLAMFGSLLFLACKKEDNGNTDERTKLPEASITNVTKERTAENNTFQFDVTLSTSTTSDVRINYTTVASTAKEGIDFVATSGTLTIPAGATKRTIDVTVIGNPLRKANQVFGVNLEQPQNCTLKNAQGVGTIVNENSLYLPVDNAGYSTPTAYPGYRLAWADEFDGKMIKPNIWTHEQGNNGGWGNNELQNYTDRRQNSFVSEGNLVIEARAENLAGFPYTSARMITKRNKAFKFGRVDIRAKLPKTKGVWPALWMLGSNIDQVGWPACGEIDMMELVGHEPSKVHQTVHYGASFASHQYKGSSYTLQGETFDEKFHVFSLEWEQDRIKMFVDDKPVFSIDRLLLGSLTPSIMNSSSYLILPLVAIGLVRLMEQRNYHSACLLII
jgi:hypothetical protein